MKPNGSPKPASPSRTAAGPKIPAKTTVTQAIAVKTTVLDGSVSYLLKRAQLSASQTFGLVMKEYEVRPRHYAVLVLIRTNPGLSQIALASALGISKANFVPVLDALQLRGFVERRKDPVDRRAAAMYLTKVGNDFVRKLEIAHLRLEKRIQTRLGSRKTNDLRMLLREFCGAAETSSE